MGTETILLGPPVSALQLLNCLILVFLPSKMQKTLHLQFFYRAVLFSKRSTSKGKCYSQLQCNIIPPSSLFFYFNNEQRIYLLKNFIIIAVFLRKYPLIVIFDSMKMF